MLETIGIHKKDISSEEWEKALKGLERGDEYRIITDGSWIEWRDEFIDTLVRDRDFIVTIRKVKKIPFPSNDDLANAFRSVGKSMCSNGLNVSENKEAKEPQDKTEQAHRQTENLDGILAERGVVYGDYGVHVDAVGDIMNILQNVCEKKNKCKMGTKVQAMNFYVVSKLVRLAATPIHEDSLKDAINYLKLMYKEIHGKEIQ